MWYKNSILLRRTTQTVVQMYKEGKVVATFGPDNKHRMEMLASIRQRGTFARISLHIKVSMGVMF